MIDKRELVNPMERFPIDERGYTDFDLLNQESVNQASREKTLLADDL